MDTTFARALNVYYCSHDTDAEWENRLEAHLTAMSRQGLIFSWHKSHIIGGTEVEREIYERLNSADIVLLLISPDFMASEFCYGLMLKALARYESQKTRVVPINLRYVELEGTPISDFQMYPRGGVPITRWDDPDEAFWHVARGIRDVIRHLSDERLNKRSDKTEVMTLEDYERSVLSPERDHECLLFPTINTAEAIRLFHMLMKSDEQIRILLFEGQGNMGKTHLLTKVFPTLAKQAYNARCIALDIRHRPLTDPVPYILEMAGSQLDELFFENYLNTEEQWNRNNKNSGIASKNIQFRNFYLTSHFVKGLRMFNDTPLFFFIDTVNEAEEKTQTWLMDILLTQLHSLPQVRVVLAGRSLPLAHGSYIASCRTFELRAVLEEQAFIDYCKSVQATLGEQSICDFAYAFDYTPGTFFSYVSTKFFPRK